jgi:hypothetical protein
LSIFVREESESKVKEAQVYVHLICVLHEIRTIDDEKYLDSSYDNLAEKEIGFCKIMFHFILTFINYATSNSTMVLLICQMLDFIGS